jgi:hypothetical protein
MLDFGLNGLFSFMTKGLLRELFIELRRDFMSLISSEVKTEGLDPEFFWEGAGGVGDEGLGWVAGELDDPEPEGEFCFFSSGLFSGV